MIIFFRLVWESIAMAINSLRVNKLRTFLSLLGISIGIFTIIMVFTVVDSFERNLNGSVAKLGNNVIYVQKWPWTFSGDFPWWKYFNRPNPNYKDFEELERRASSQIDAVAFQIDISGKTLKYKSNSVENVSIIAGSHSYDQVRSMEFEQGRYFSLSDSRSGRNYALIGVDIAEGLFPNEEPIGKEIKLMGRKLRVIGVLKREGEDILNNTVDGAVFIPINFARNLVDTRSDRYNPLIMVKAAGGVELTDLRNELRGLLRSIRKVSPKEEDDFSLNQSSMLAIQMEAVFGIVDIAGWIIGGFSILVGGFGIANIMFVSVKERTNIIGIQKSLGAKKHFILLQFLTEAIVLCFIGGSIGLILVWFVTLLAGLANFSIALSFANIVLGITVSVIIGVISGFTPALTAARMDPVEAIRSK